MKHSTKAAALVSSFYGGRYPQHAANIDLCRADKVMNSSPDLSKVLGQNQWDALSSVVLSVLQGEAHHPREHELFGCSMFKNLESRKFQLALADLYEYVYVNGRFSPELSARRKIEAKLFLTPDNPVV